MLFLLTRNGQLFNKEMLFSVRGQPFFLASFFFFYYLVELVLEADIQ